MKLSVASKNIITSVLISMTDVIFLLLLFLLIASNFTAQTGLPFRLPGSSSQKRQTMQILNLVYTGEGVISYRGETYDLRSLGPALKKDFRNSEQVVRLSAAKSTPLQDVISIMDIIRDAGYERIFVATEAVLEKPDDD